MCLCCIREQDPLKQGLKQSRSEALKKSFFIIREQDPLKQGLKLIESVTVQPVRSIREQDPLKQGLKPYCVCVFDPENSIREQDPLKQGLKLTFVREVRGVALKFESKIH